MSPFSGPLAVKLVKHGGLARDGGKNVMRIQRGRRDAVDGSFGVGSAEEIVLCVGGSLFTFDGELGSSKG